jgi:hypothetical protein
MADGRRHTITIQEHEAVPGERVVIVPPAELADELHNARLASIMRSDLERAKSKFRIRPNGTVSGSITITATTTTTVAIDVDQGVALAATAVPPVYRPSLLLDLLVPLDRAQDMHANLGELYPSWVERHGAGRASWIRRSQVALLIGGTWWEKILSTCERLLKVVRLIGL